MDSNECGYCGTTELAYKLESHRGPVVRCIECLAIEQGQQELRSPFESFVDFEPMFEDETREDVEEQAKRSYHSARGWYGVLARLQQDDPLVKRDPESIGTLPDGIRTFLTNIMGADAHKRPSEVTHVDE